MDRFPSVGSVFSIGKHCHSHQEQSRRFPDALQVPKLRLDPVSSCLCCCHGCQWKGFRRSHSSTSHSGTDIQFWGDNCRVHDTMVGPQLGLHRVLPPPCTQVLSSSLCGLHQNLISKNQLANLRILVSRPHYSHSEAI